MNLRRFHIAYIILAIVFSCQDSSDAPSELEVKNYGALKTIMSGDTRSVIALDSLYKTEHLYGLGALEDLKGEILIVNGNPIISTVKDSSAFIDKTFNHKASLFVYSQVREWTNSTIDTVSNLRDVERLITTAAEANKLNTNSPLAFMIEAKVSSLQWHIIDWKEGDTIHTHQKHKESGLHGTIRDTKVQILGFYSTQHKGVFTHHSTSVHMHFKTADNTLGGHIDDVLFTDPILLKLPSS